MLLSGRMIFYYYPAYPVSGRIAKSTILCIPNYNMSKKVTEVAHKFITPVSLPSPYKARVESIYIYV